MNDYPYHPAFHIADGKTPVAVTLEGTEIRVIRSQDGKQIEWTLDNDLKPMSHTNGNKTFVYSDGKFEGIAAFEQTPAGHEHPVSRQSGGVDMIPAVMASIVAASAKPGFPEELAKKIPAAFAALGLALPDRRDPPG